MIILGNNRPVFIIAGNPQEANNWTHRYLRYVRSHEILEGHHDPIVILVGSYYARKDYDFLRDLIIANTRKSQENVEVEPSATSNNASGVIFSLLEAALESAMIENIPNTVYYINQAMKKLHT